MKEQIQKLKKEKDFVILAHYYVDGSVQEIADYVGDSYYLSEIATKVNSENILFAGVSFMGESAKILNPKKHVYMAEATADCPMAHMVDEADIKRVRAKYDDISVVCYVNSSAQIKALSDVCVTSSNAVNIVKKLKSRYIYFIPDNNLGHYVAKQVKDKEFIFHDGFCHVHKSINAELVMQAKQKHQEALILTHPECTADVLEISDFIGSTSQIIDYATASENESFIICTEMGVFFELMQKNPNKKFYSVGHRQFCPNMKKVSLKNIIEVLENPANEIVVSDEIIKQAAIALERMLALSAGGE